MSRNRLLVADADAKAWDEFRQALGETWTVVGVGSDGAALAEAEKQPFDVVVANYELPGKGGAELLNRFLTTNPKTHRIIAAEATMRDKVMSSAVGSQQFLAVPFDRANLKSSIERSLEVDYGMSTSVRELVGRIRSFPTIPSIYVEVVNALKDPNTTTAEIGEIISKDLAMTTKLVQVINSAYFGLPRNITDPAEAVGLMGFEAVKSLIMTVKLLSQYDKIRPVYFSIDHIWRHSTNVARTARVMALIETNDNQCSSTAYTAGLMHDLGKVILAANFDEQYHGAHTISRKRQIPLWEVEKDIFGATHGEIGAYLLSLWGVAPDVVKVAALHHQPSRADDNDFTPLTAVHVANVLEYEAVQDTEGLPAPMIDTGYLERLGMADRIDLWRFARRNPDSAKSDTKHRRKKTAAVPAPTPAPANVFAESPTSAPQTTESQTSEPETRATSYASPTRRGSFAVPWKWIGIGVGTCAAIGVLIMLELFRLERAAEQTEAKLPEAIATAVEEKAIVATVAPISARKATPAPVPSPAAQTSTAPARAVRQAPAPELPPLERLQLQAVFYNSKKPTALINGLVATVGDEIEHCRVLEIAPSSVTFQYQKQRKTLTLR